MEHTYRIGRNRLTPNGYRMSYILGTQLSSEFNNFLGEPIKPQEIQVFCASTLAAQSTANGFLLGFTRQLNSISTMDTPIMKEMETQYSKYPEFWRPEFTKDRFDHPFPLTIESESEDLMFLPDLKNACPRAYKHIQSDAVAGQYVIEKHISSLSKLLYKKGIYPGTFGSNSWTSSSISDLYDILHSYEYETGILFSGIKEPLYHKLRKIKTLNTMKTIQITKRQQDLKLFTHGIFSTISEAMSEIALDEDSKIKFQMFSSTGKSFLAFVMALEYSDFDCVLNNYEKSEESNRCVDFPDYASSITFQLSKSPISQKLFLRLRLNGQLMTFPKLSKYSVGQSFYKFDEFVDYLEERCIKDDFEEFCGNDEIDPELESNLNEYYPMLVQLKWLLIFINLVSISLTLTVLWFENKKVEETVNNVVEEFKMGEMDALQDEKGGRVHKNEKGDGHQMINDTLGEDDLGMNQMTTEGGLMTTERSGLGDNSKAGYGFGKYKDPFKSDDEDNDQEHDKTFG